MHWFRIASHLGVPLQELQEKTTSCEFVEWIRYLDLEVSSFHREDYYWAMIAAEIRRANVKNPQRIKIKDFLLKFKSAYEKRPNRTGKRSTMKESKSFWLSALGLLNKVKV